MPLCPKLNPIGELVLSKVLEAPLLLVKIISALLNVLKRDLYAPNVGTAAASITAFAASEAAFQRAARSPAGSEISSGCP